MGGATGILSAGGSALIFFLFDNLTQALKAEVESITRRLAVTEGAVAGGVGREDGEPIQQGRGGKPAQRVQNGRGSGHADVGKEGEEEEEDQETEQPRGALPLPTPIPFVPPALSASTLRPGVWVSALSRLGPVPMVGSRVLDVTTFWT
jgi:hypothetical protein